MKITFPKTQFLSNLYPGVDLNDDEQLSKAVKDSYLPVIAQVRIEGDFIHIILPDKGNDKNPNEFYKATELCTQRKYSEAIPILEKLISTNPEESEFHRNLAQGLFLFFLIS